MLVSLHVKNLALIDETEVFFENGLNILTGETGAGKSIIIGSINLALGARADKEMIRTGADYALIELIFQVENETHRRSLREMDIPIEEDGTLLIQRKIMPNRNVCKVCGEAVTARTLKDLAGVLIDIHSQHEHQSLFHPKKHMELLDSFCKEELEPVKKKLTETYHVYSTMKKEAQEALDEAAKEREISLAEFEVAEIQNAHLQEGEDEELEKRYSRMINSRKITESVGNVYELTGNTNVPSATEQIGKAARELRNVAAFDETLLQLEESLLQVDSLLNDFNRTLSDYITDMEFDEKEFADIEERLNLINHLKSKYGNQIPEILSYGTKQEEKLEKLKSYETYRLHLKEELLKTEKRLASLCEEASKIRECEASKLSRRMTNALLALNFLSVQFEIQVRKKEGAYSANGYNEVEFMISTNPGEPIKSLCDVASGGELSRVMLALKTVLAENDETDTLIFDEIDAGISGKTAWKVSEQLGILGRNHQIICITHLPQIAAMADSHFVIEKKAEHEVTTTTILKIKEEEQLRELARLLGGETITEAVLNNAKEMKDLAVKTKETKSKF